jgi:hypothetical protein
MGDAKRLRVEPIECKDARKLVTRLHYSGTYARNSQLCFGVFWNGKAEGVMMFGPCMDKRKMQGLVENTGWNGFIELNRMAFSDKLPRNSESRALAIAFKMMKKAYPHLEWVVSFADASQCGDGAIYRASGFVLTGIRANNTLLKMPSGNVFAAMTLEAHWDERKVKEECRAAGLPHMYRSRREWIAEGASFIPGFQLRYVYFLNREAKSKLAVPVLPFEIIDELKAGMYRGERVTLLDRKPYPKRPKQAMDSDQESQRRCDTDPDAPGIADEQA